MGSRQIPYDCPHGRTLDWGDFGPDPDDGSVGAETCEECGAEEWPGPFTVAGCSDKGELTVAPGWATIGLASARREAAHWNERHQRTRPGSTFRYIVCQLVEVPDD